MGIESLEICHVDVWISDIQDTLFQEQQNSNILTNILVPNPDGELYMLQIVTYILPYNV